MLWIERLKIFYSDLKNNNNLFISFALNFQNLFRVQAAQNKAKLEDEERMEKARSTKSML